MVVLESAKKNKSSNVFEKVTLCGLWTVKSGSYYLNSNKISFLSLPRSESNSKLDLCQKGSERLVLVDVESSKPYVQRVTENMFSDADFRPKYSMLQKAKAQSLQPGLGEYQVAA